jgi:hypothetical protein
MSNMGKRVTLLTVLLLSMSATLASQTTVTMGDVSGANNSFPFNYGINGRFQHSYSSTEIGLAGGGTVVEVRVHGSTVAPPTFNNFRLRLGHSTLTPLGLTGTFDTNYTGNLTVCMGDTGTSSPVSVAPTTATSTVAGRQWYVFALTTGFQYNGTNDLLLDWSYDSRVGTGWTVSSLAGRNRVYLNGGGATSPTGTSLNSGNIGIELIVQVGPQLTVSVTPGVAQAVYANAQGPGGTGKAVAKFDIASNSQGPMTLTGIEVKADGTADDSTAYQEVAVYRDTDSSGTFAFGTDALAVTSAGNFTVDDGTIGFSVVTSEQGFMASQTRTYFIVVKLAGTALPSQTLNFVVSDITVAANTKGGVPSGVMAGLVIDTPVFNVADVSSPTTVSAVLGTAGNVCQEFTISYPAGPADKPAGITVTGLGTADEAADLAAVELWWDSDNSASYSGAVDTLIDSSAYAQDNGTVVFDLAALSNFQQGTTRRFFVVYNLNVNGSDHETFRCYVSAVSGMPLGGIASGLPAPGAGGTEGLEVSALLLSAALNGPVSALTVSSNSAGMTGDGELMCDVTLAAAPGASWTASALTYRASGTGQYNAAFSEVALYEDDSSGTWDGALIDTLAAGIAPGFSSGLVTFSLANNAFPAGTSRRFFLVAKLNGTALTAQTFNANLQSVAAVPPTNGYLAGVPTPVAPALIIDAAALEVTNGPNQPNSVTHPAGSPASYVAAQFRLRAINGSITVSSVDLTTGGTGNWVNDIDSSMGVSVYEDDGDGAFNAAADGLLYQGGGGATVSITPPTPLIIAAGSYSDLWVRLRLTSTAGGGVQAVPETFTVSIAAPGGVNASSIALLGNPAPNGVSIGAIAFLVSSFDPPKDQPKGGSPIVIEGSGFVGPFSVSIGGVICPGTSVIAGGTEVTGLYVPPGGGANLPIEISSGKIPTQVIGTTFTYGSVGSTSSNPPASEGCASSSGSRIGVAVLIALFAALGSRTSVLRGRANHRRW